MHTYIHTYTYIYLHIHTLTFRRSHDIHIFLIQSIIRIAMQSHRQSSSPMKCVYCATGELSICMHVCMFACLYVCMFVRLYVCMLKCSWGAPLLVDLRLKWPLGAHHMHIHIYIFKIRPSHYVQT